MHHNIVYLSHGGPKYYDQTRFSALTLLDLLLKEQRNDIRIVVFTDRPQETPAHDLIHSIHVSSEKMKRFRGPLDYVHRIKLEVLRRAEGEIGLPFIYVDCDTRWLKIPDAQLTYLADSGRRTGDARPPCYMYENDGTISPDFFPQYFRLLQKKRNRLIEWGVQAAPPWPMWNSGTVGVPSGAAGFFDKALEINDELLLEVRCRNWIEQLALALVAAGSFDVKPFDDCLAHYWGFSYELPVLLHRFFAGLPSGLSTEKMAEQCALFPLNEADLRQIQRARANRFKIWRAKMRNSLYKRKIDLKAWRLRSSRR
jgi:hypothetical protein